ncbi:NB-ARC domain-containing protein [Methylophilus sp. DW102]|uniref:NACHT domain-containing protein n=1 Tax=Methylophilus sp. DW102 TaxID=3095607 RepID=UPI00308FD67F|nr:NACHT domain-containing protein [Methylophilus sp. DW102]
MIEFTEIFNNEYAKTAINTLIKSAVEKGLKGLKKNIEPIKEALGYRLQDYIEFQKDRYKCLNTIVFNQKISLEEIYIPLTLVSEVEDLNGKRKEIPVSKFDLDFLPKHPRVLITDNAGMGKSTILKFLLLKCIESEYAIPVFLELRHLASSKSIIDTIINQLNIVSTTKKYSDELELSKSYIERIIKNGDFIFFFDGYDEIPFKDREEITVAIKEFISKNQRNIFVISSRKESGLASFSGFDSFSIRPLKKTESYQLIRKYDNDGEKSSQLIEKLENKEYSGINEYLKNPLLCTLLYRCYEYKQNLPLKKHVFYRQVFDALFDWHDATKDGYNTRQKLSKLDLDSFHRVLRLVGFISVMHGKFEADKDTVLDWIRESKRICSDLTFSESDFLDDCVRAVPVLIQEGTNYRWSHKSLSEYFAAQFLCTEGKSELTKILNEILASEDLSKFSNVIEQIYDIEPAIFREVFVAPMAESFREYCSNTYKGMNTKISNESLQLRKTLTFSKQIYIARATDKNIHSFLDGSLDESYFHRIGLFHVGDKQRFFYFESGNKFQDIIDILATKKDPLVTSTTKLNRDNKIKRLVKLTAKSRINVNDDPENVLNDLRNFDVVNSVILRSDKYILDADRVLNYQFENSQNKVATLASCLLKNLKPQ